MTHPSLWEATELFSNLLEAFEDTLRKAQVFQNAKPDAHFGLAVAYSGFLSVASPKLWGPNHLNFLMDKLDSDLSPDNFSEFEGAAEALIIFECLALGVMLAKYAMDQLDDLQYSYGEIQLPVFVLNHTSEIESKFNTAMKS